MADDTGAGHVVHKKSSCSCAALIWDRVTGYGRSMRILSFRGAKRRGNPYSFGIRLPRQSEDWLAMTDFVVYFERRLSVAAACTPRVLASRRGHPALRGDYR